MLLESLDLLVMQVSAFRQLVKFFQLWMVITRNVFSSWLMKFM